MNLSPQVLFGIPASDCWACTLSAYQLNLLQGRVDNNQNEHLFY
jgi:hypothetical protein